MQCFLNDGYLFYLKTLPTWTQPSRRKWSKILTDLFCFHQDRALTALKDAAKGCTTSYKHGDLQIGSHRWMCHSHCLWIKAGSLTICIYNCYSHQCQRDGFTQTQQPHLWLLDTCYLPSKASGEKEQNMADRSTTEEQLGAKTLEAACLPLLFCHLQAVWAWTSHLTTLGPMTSQSGFENSVHYRNALPIMHCPCKVITIWVLDIIILFHVLYKWPVSRELMKVTSNFPSKWPQIDDGSLDTNFINKRDIFVHLFASQLRLCFRHSSPLAKTGRWWPLCLPLWWDLSGLGPWPSLLPCLLMPGFALSFPL